jgi:hypothetical protein
VIHRPIIVLCLLIHLVHTMVYSFESLNYLVLLWSMRISLTFHVFLSFRTVYREHNMFARVAQAPSAPIKTMVRIRLS